jgi:PKHD-type hydroxylase
MHWYWKGELPDLICDEIIREGESLGTKEAVIGAGEGVLDLEIRKSKISWINQNWLFKLLWEYVIEANKSANWNYQVERFEPLQYTKYEAPGSHYDWHMDHYEPNTNGNQKELLRKLSVTVQLTDPKEYDGGGFEQIRLAKTPEGELDKEISTLDAVSSRGSILVFPGFVWHRVLPVTKGTRRSLVGWVVGKPYV